jgi:hypothetical protein
VTRKAKSVVAKTPTADRNLPNIPAGNATQHPGAGPAPSPGGPATGGISGTGRSGGGGVVVSDPATLRKASTAFGVAVQELKDAVSKLNSAVTQEAKDDPWGDDDTGRSFANGDGSQNNPGYVSTQNTLLQNLNQLADLFQGAADAFDRQAQAWTSQEQHAEQTAAALKSVIANATPVGEALGGSLSGLTTTLPSTGQQTTAGSGGALS